MTKKLLDNYQGVHLVRDYKARVIAVVTLHDGATVNDLTNFCQRHVPGYEDHQHLPDYLAAELEARAADIEARMQHTRVSRYDAEVATLSAIFSELHDAKRHSCGPQKGSKKARPEAEREHRRKAFLASRKPAPQKVDPRRKRIQELEQELEKLRGELEDEACERVIQQSFERRHHPANRPEGPEEPTWGRNRGEHVLQTELT